MVRVATLAIVAVSLVVLMSLRTAAPPARLNYGLGQVRADTGWKLVWADEFDIVGRPNPKNWDFEKGFVRNNELQWYQADNTR